MPRPDRLLLLTLLGIVLAGGHLGLLQVVAWTSMLIDRCSSQPLALAISTTFDGEHPCQLCRALDEQDAADKTNEHQPTVIAKFAKIVCLISDIRVVSVPSVDHRCWQRPLAESGEGIALAPPVRPPPRS